jgi:ubiquinone biosynthesis protein UbiJ
MATQSPFPFLDDLFSKAAATLQPPAWAVEEIQRRLALLANHVLMQEPEAQARLARQAGRVVEAHWRAFVMRLRATPAGLLEIDASTTQPDLTLTLTEESPWELAQVALRGDKPPVRIAGDVQFAAEINWLVENVRWDLEEDLSRIVGDAPAHAIGDAGRRVVAALRQFVTGTAAKPDAVPSAATGAAGSGQAASTGSGQA